MQPNEFIADLEKTMSELGGVGALKDLIQKATDNSTGFSTRQSLSDQVEDLTIKNTPLFDMLPRETVVNPIHQWDAITSLATGIATFSGAIDSVGVDADPIITRYSEAVRYYRTTTTVGQFTNAMSRPQLGAQVTVDEKAIESIKHDIEKDIIVGADGGNNIRGINDVITDLAPAANNVNAGSVAMTSTANIDTAQRRIVEQGGLPTHIVFNTEDAVDFRDLFTSVTYPSPQSVNRFGYTVTSYIGTYGEVQILWDLFVGAKSTTSNAYVIDIRSWALGEPVVNGASGIALQDLAKTGPRNTKLVNYYGVLVYRAPARNARVYDIA